MLRNALHIAVAIAVVIALSGISFGKSNDDERVLSKITFIHYRHGNVKPVNGGGGKPKDSGYYSLMGGAKWKAVEDVRINMACGENSNGELDDTIYNAVASAMNEWETPGTATINVMGDLIVDDTVTYDDGAYRGYNTISFGSYSDSNVIAITTVWGYFGGKPDTREIIEAHMLFNDSFEWGDATVDSTLMDIQNIATHELGHWIGLADLYQSGAIDETMYGYSTEGETKKRDLYKGDIAGVTKLYPAQ